MDVFGNILCIESSHCLRYLNVSRQKPQSKVGTHTLKYGRRERNNELANSVGVSGLLDVQGDSA